MARHVAVIQPPYDRMILDGRKRIESRLTKSPRPPYGRVTPGDTIHFKRSGGPFVAVACVRRVLTMEIESPSEIDRLAKRYNRWIGAPPTYWTDKRLGTRYVTLIWFDRVEPSTRRPDYTAQHMAAW